MSGRTLVGVGGREDFGCLILPRVRGTRLRADFGLALLRPALAGLRRVLAALRRV